MIRDLHFAESAVRIEANGNHAEDLLMFLSKGVPKTGKAFPHVVFKLEDVESTSEIQLFILEKNDSESLHPASPIASNIPHITTKGPANLVASQLLFYVDFHLANIASHGLYLHAASLAKNGKAILLPGNSGSGKSALTFWLAQNGFYYMSDEATFVPSGTRECQGFTRPLHLRDDGVKLFDQIDSIPKLAIKFSEKISFGYLLDVSNLNPAKAGETNEINTIIFPSYKEGSDLVFEKLSPAMAVFELAQCLINARNLYQNGFPEIMRLAKAVPSWRLIYGHFDQVKRLLQDSKFGTI